MKHSARPKPMPRHLPRLLHPMPRIPAHSLRLLFSAHSGPSSKDRTADVAALTIVVDAADAIAVGVNRVAGATGGQAANFPHQNMLRRGPLIRGRVDLKRMNPLPLTINPLSSLVN